MSKSAKSKGPNLRKVLEGPTFRSLFRKMEKPLKKMSSQFKKRRSQIGKGVLTWCLAQYFVAFSIEELGLIVAMILDRKEF